MPGFAWQFTGGDTLSTPMPVTALVQRYVPPTAVTSGSEAGQATLGYGIVAGFLTGSFIGFAVPLSPVEARSVMWLARAAMKAWRSCERAARPSWNVPSPAPKLILTTSAR